MLTINPVTSASRPKDYYGVADYYTEGQETVGNWGGKLADAWGLIGKVTQDAFDALCDRLHPLTGKPLTAKSGQDGRVAYDFTVSLNKSASIVRAFADDELAAAMDAARDDALAVMMEAVEADMQCRERRNGADHDVKTGNLIYAAFHHTTARPTEGQPPDMDEHTHALVFNCTKSPDGRMLAGQFGDLKGDGEYYSALFDARYVANLQRLGFVIDKTGGKGWEIAGITPEMIDTFSKRKHQIEAEATRQGITDRKAKGELGAKTRGKKQKELTRDELNRAWRDQLSDADRDALAAVYRREGNGGPTIAARDAVAHAVGHCFEREAVVSEKELVRVALLYGLGDVTPDQVRQEMHAQGVLLAEKDGRLMATTEEAYGMERFIVGFAKEGRSSVMPAGMPAGLERGILDRDQWQAVKSLLTSCDRVQLVDSAAGVGKSTMLGVYDQGMKRAGRHVTYLGSTTSAVGVLCGDGFQAETVARFLLSEKMQAEAKGGYVVVDEASMLGLKDAYRLFSIASEKNIRLVFLGDSRQHSSVAAGAFMRTMQEYAYLEPIRIAEIKRQENRDHREAVKLLFEGRTLEGFDRLDAKLGWVNQIEDDAARYAAMAAEYAAARKRGMAWDEILLIAPTHAEGERCTAAVRERLREEKLIGGEEREFTRWVSADLTDAQKADGRNYRPGVVDMIQFHRNTKTHTAGSRVMIGGNDASPLDQPSAFQAYRQETVSFAKGDIIRFTANGVSMDGHRIRNGSAYQIAGFSANGIRLSNGWLVSRDFGHFKHGIETSYGSQGKTVKLAIVGQSSASFAASNMEQAYVSASRAKQKVSIYTDDRDGLRRAIQRSSLKLAAHDLLKPKPQPKPKQLAWRKRLAKLARLALLERNRLDAAAGSPLRMPPMPHLDRLERQERGQGHER